MTKTILSLMIAACGGCWTGSAAAQSTMPAATPTASSNEAQAEPPAPPPIADAMPTNARTTSAAPQPASMRHASPPRVAAAESTATPAVPVAVAGADPSAPAEPSAAMDPAATAPPAPPETAEKSAYITAGGLYLPIDDGYLAASAGAGMRVRSGIQEARVGARISYGFSPYSSVFAVLVGGAVIRWWGRSGIGLLADLGLVVASEKMGGGWDGTTFGGTFAGTFRHRFQKTELSFDLGLVYAAGEDDPTAPFAMISVLAPL